MYQDTTMNGQVPVTHQHTTHTHTHTHHVRTWNPLCTRVGHCTPHKHSRLQGCVGVVCVRVWRNELEVQRWYEVYGWVRGYGVYVFTSVCVCVSDWCVYGYSGLRTPDSGLRTPDNRQGDPRRRLLTTMGGGYSVSRHNWYRH